MRFEIITKEQREIMLQDELNQKRDFLNFDCFEKFFGHNVIIENKDLEATYLYKNLSIDYHTYDQLILIDGDNGCRTWIPLDFVDNINNLSDDLYEDVITIETAHYIWEIVCAEEKFKYPRCYKCDKEILVPEETIWGNLWYCKLRQLL